MSKPVYIDNPTKPFEVTCPVCDGCGLLKDEFKRNCFGVSLCTECNGHGVVLTKINDDANIPKYSVTPEVKCKFVNLSRF
jgi:DnaJ-class molecular chaperone